MVSWVSRFVPYVLLVFIGIANALPVPLTSFNLSLYLADNGFGHDAIGLFSLLAIPLSLKLLWSPLIDTCSLPFFSQSPRKGWMAFSLIGMALSLAGMGLINPGANTGLFAASLFSLCSFTGCLYIVGLAYELESIDENSYSLGSASIVAGYRLGLLFAGAGVLYIAYLYSWQVAFLSMAAILLLGCIAVVLQREPYKSQAILAEKRMRFSNHASLYSAFWHETIRKPSSNFFQRQDWLVVLLIIILFKSGNHIAKAMEGPFYLDIGFSKA
ncbi:MAG: MFS transporter, partial [Verrucomicrobia bacterium]|nr:MFS transporter [Verrucomicrobiota bacterium]